jgi:hypothetical protein
MRKNNLLMIAFLLGSCECSDEKQLNKALGTPCYTDQFGEVIETQQDSKDYEERNLGACATGNLIKDRSSQLFCEDEIRPKQEICNNIDDDCNGYIDDNRWIAGFPLKKQNNDPENFCYGEGACEYAYQVCFDGVWECIYPMTYGEEVCDGIDNDCDGRRDEDTEEEPLFSLEDRYVYTGDPDTINMGECRAGYKECINGDVYIRNMRTPIGEICGNGDDDDCDGFIDEDENQERPTDYLFVIDFSGSMQNIIGSLANSLCSWSAQGILSTSRFAVIAVGYGGNDATNEIKLLTDFTDSNTACTIIQDNNISQTMVVKNIS